MKLQNKLFIQFTLLFFILLNVFGYLLVQSLFINSINTAIDSGFIEYTVIYSNLKTGENMSKLFFDDEDVIRIKNNAYLSNAQSADLNLYVRDENMNVIYTTFSEDITLYDELDTFNDDNDTNYMISNDDNNHTLIINRKITLNDNTYYLTYFNNIQSLYTEKNHYLMLLLLFNLIAGVISICVIYIFSGQITKPINSLIDNVNEIIHQNYSVKLETNSDIEEINTLTNSFNIMNNEISNQIEALESENQAKQRFIDSLTHEIRTPLTAIIGYSSLCLNKNIEDPKILKNAFENIYHNGKRIENMTENLIKLITLDKQRLDIEPINVKQVNDDIEASMKQRLDENHITFNQFGDDFVVMGDEYLLTTLFTNFIDNAIKAVAESDPKVIDIIYMDHQVIIEDHGKGIAKEDIDKIFEPFYMADKSRKRTLHGFGLGLSICASIMEILDIKFDILSEVGIGTRISLMFGGDSYEEI